MIADPFADLPPLSETIAAHGLSAKKALGQNFLLDPNLLAKIARIPGDLRGQQIYEVGPGPGGLTRALLKAGARVTAVELDSRCLPALRQLAEMSGGNLSVIEGDALTIDEPSTIGSAHVAANLPYNVGTALLVRWLETPWLPWWRSLTLMFQREVAERIVALPRTGAYGRLSILAQWRATPRIAMRLPARAFVPAPKVDSAIVHITTKAQPAGVDAKILSSLTAAAFGQRRKMLRASLKAVPNALGALETLGIEATRRPETVTVQEFVEIARCLSDR